jgi:hypothetical protein
MNENSFEWFNAQVKSVKEHVEETWPDWMKNTADVATASFPQVGPDLKKTAQTSDEPPLSY